MSRTPYMPWWIGDYLRDTQHLTTEQHGAYLLLLAHCWQHGAIPLDDVGQAQVVRLLPVKRWNAIKAAILPFFEPDGTHRRVMKEHARVEHLNSVRAVAGSKGGFRSAASKKLSKSRSPPQANRPPNSQSNGTPNTQLKSSSAVAYQNQNQNLTSSSESEAARARSDEMPTDQQDNTAGSLATALCGGALTRPPDAEPAAQESKPPSEVKRAELEATFERRRARDAEVAAERTRRVWGRSQPPPLAVEKQEPEQP